MFMKLYNRVRCAHIPHRYIYGGMALLSLGGCMGLDKAIYGAGIALGYSLLGRDCA